jgi:hypothetical protein
VKLSNPWKDPENKKKQEWTGKYNRKDPFWSDKSTKKEIEGQVLKENEFLMDVQDFKDTFKYFTASYYDKDMKNSFIEKRNAVNKQSYKFNFEITDKDFGHSI